MYYNAGIVAVNSKVVGLAPGANPPIVSYSASAFKVYNATTNIVRFEAKILSSIFEKRFGLLCTMLALKLPWDWLLVKEK
jgi:hypothetical protein